MGKRMEKIVYAVLQSTVTKEEEGIKLENSFHQHTQV